jgi:branched-chain amino acid transport system ATP-binding protein
VLKINNVETYYDLIYALKGVSLAIEEGTITAILGNNGAGKSTVLKTVMGLIKDQPEKGSIEFGGRRIDGADTEAIVKRGISFVPEGREIWDELTVKENIMMGSYMRRGKASIKKDNERIYGYFPVLKDRENQLAGTLSGGEQQMLAISRALMNAPKLLLLDEPSLGLSPLLVKTIFGIIKTIRDEGVTIVLVEQNARMALQIADYGYVMEGGRFVMKGTSRELMEDRDVQEFYLGIKSDVSAKGYQRWKWKKRWR